VLELEGAKDLPAAALGSSEALRVGEYVVAIGNPFGLGHTVTIGVISATARSFQMVDNRFGEMLQTDAAINPGNSGGPLLNLRGEVIGMNTAIISNGRVEGNLGIGFAVPINTVRELLPQLHTGKVIRGRIGVEVTALPSGDAYRDFGLKSRTGALVRSVAPGGAADRASIEPGDVVIEFNGRPVPNTNELVKMVTATKPGTSVPVKVVRDGKEQTLNVTVDELDLEAEQQGRQSRAPSAEPGAQGSDSFGLALTNITPQRARQLQLPSGVTGALVTEVDPDGPSAGVLRQGDVILSVNSQRVASAEAAGRALAAVQDGRIARLQVWREDTQIFLTVRKE
jgi:serine protease Do